MEGEPEANIGIATGAAAGIVVIDVDRRDSLAALEAERGPLPVKRTAETGGGGLHLIYRRPKDGLRNSAGKLAPGIDVRGDGGYIVAPPSIHLSGKEYRWVVTVEVVELPGWLLDRLRVPAKRPASTATHIPSTKTGSKDTTGSQSFPRFVTTGSSKRLPASAQHALWESTEERHRRIITAALAMLLAGFPKQDIIRTVLASPCAEKVRERGEGWLRGQVDRAAAAIGDSPVGPEGFIAAVHRHIEVADAAHVAWASREGRRLRRVLWCFQRLALERRRPVRWFPPRPL